MDEKLKAQLLSMQSEDLDMRNSLLNNGSLYEGYDVNMEALHIKNAETLSDIINKHGWPGKSLVGEDGARAAAMIAQHSISKPELQRFFLTQLKIAISNNEANPIQGACLEDRILFNEGKPCLYGMLFDWDVDGNLIANVDDESLVNERRKELGLKTTLAEALAKHREEIENEGGEPPTNIQEHKKKGAEWARRVGWQ